jgi:Nif-specific regulatory protein
MNNKNPFEALLEITAELNSIHELDQVLERVMDIAIETVSAERGFIVLKKSGKANQTDVVCARRFREENVNELVTMSTSVVKKVLSDGQSILTYDALEDDRFRNAESVQLHKIHSVICVPLKYDGDVLGAIYMDNRTNVGRFNQESLDFLNAFSRQSAVAIINARVFQQLQNQNTELQSRLSQQKRYPRIIGSSKEILQIFDLIDKVAATEATVLIEGESGTGKELVAQAIHDQSKRREKIFIPIYCGSLSENLLESELFGHKKGAFTGATDSKQGLFEEANGGTFFLDEIADISKNMQTKLLRVLQEGEVKRVGESRIFKVDVRIIAASNKDLWEQVQQNNFREDLYYRLNVIKLKLPPLRERRSDIPILANFFLKTYCDKNKKYIKNLSNQAMDRLINYNWPGNVRELENTIERAVILARGTQIEPDDLQMHENAKGTEGSLNLKEVEKHIVLKTLKEFNGNRTHAARALGVSRRWLQYQLKAWGISDADTRL